MALRAKLRAWNQVVLGSRRSLSLLLYTQRSPAQLPFQLNYTEHLRDAARALSPQPQSRDCGGDYYSGDGVMLTARDIYSFTKYFVHLCLIKLRFTRVCKFNLLQTLLIFHRFCRFLFPSSRYFYFLSITQLKRFFSFSR